MPLVYLPEDGVLFLWGGVPSGSVLSSDVLSDGVLSRDSVRGGAVLPELSTIQPLAVARSATIVTPEGRREVSGLELPLLGAVAALAVAPAEAPERSTTVAAWVMASKLALELVARERVVPVIQREGGQLEARWAAALASSEDASQLMALARSLPPAAHAVPAIGGGELDVWAPEALLRAFIDAVVDALLRSVRGAPGAGRGRAGWRGAGRERGVGSALA